jgi:hypothetical protein
MILLLEIAMTVEMFFTRARCDSAQNAVDRPLVRLKQPKFAGPFARRVDFADCFVLVSGIHQQALLSIRGQPDAIHSSIVDRGQRFSAPSFTGRGMRPASHRR